MATMFHLPESDIETFKELCRRKLSWDEIGARWGVSGTTAAKVAKRIGCFKSRTPYAPTHYGFAPRHVTPANQALSEDAIAALYAGRRYEDDARAVRLPQGFFRR